VPGAPSVGLAHDYLLFLRGAERTFAEMAACFPAAPIYTAAYRERDTDGWFAGRDIRTSRLQALGVTRRWFRALLPLYPRAIESLRFDDHDLVVSSSFAFAHGIRPGPNAVHVCYCHSPFRYAWHERERALASLPAPARPLLDRTLNRIKRWDLQAADRVSAYIANAQITADRIGNFYGRDAKVVHPPVDVERFAPAPAGTRGEGDDFFLLVGELVAHKRTRTALEAARLAGAPAVVVGAGPELRPLRAEYSTGVEFLGRVGDEELASLYARARAVVIPNVEEFGIVAVEAQAAGRPVIALDAGGARETVIDGETGILVPDPSPDSFAEVMREVDFEAFAARRARESAERFSVSRFRAKLLAALSELGGRTLV
jgi:glycosyltransferase involved in cell wall biosynthesis